jgi:hypothetical protein
MPQLEPDEPEPEYDELEERVYEKDPDEEYDQWVEDRLFGYMRLAEIEPAKSPDPSGRRSYVERPKSGTEGFGEAPRKQGRAVVGAALTDGSAMTVLGASRVLGVSEKRVRQFIEGGKLELLNLPKTDERGKRIPTQVTTNSVIVLRTKRGSKGAMPPKKVRKKLSKPSKVDIQLKALSKQVAALATNLMRPKKQTRDVLLNVRVTQQEADLLRKEAAKRGVSVSHLLRTVPRVLEKSSWASSWRNDGN